MDKLTDKQENVLAYIRDFMRKTGYPPTVREIGKHFKIASSSVFDHLKALEGKGALKRKPGCSRSLVLEPLDESKNLPFRKHPPGAEPRIAKNAPPYPHLLDDEVIQIPLLGRVAAGIPLLAEENVEEMITFPRQWVSTGQIFALRVTGDSMIHAGIQNGDCVLVKMQPEASDGDIVVALLEDEATVKQFYKRGHSICLRAANPQYADRIVREVKILGKVIGLFRTYL